MSTVIIHKVGGGSFEIPAGNLENTRRLLGDQIAHVEQKGESVNLVNAIDENLILEITDTDTGEKTTTEVSGKQTLEDLELKPIEELREMADNLSKEKAIAKANARSGIKKLALYCFNNQ